MTHQAVKILTSSDITIDSCDFSHTGMGGIDCGVKNNGEYGVSNLTIRNTHLDENGWYGPYAADWADGLAIEIGGGNIIVENCTAIHNRADGFDSKTENTVVGKCTALNNLHNQIKLWADNALIVNCIAANTSSESGYWDCIVFEGTPGDAYRMYNSLIYGSQNYAMIAGYDNPGTNAYFEVKNCIFANNKGGVYFQSSAQVAEDHNIYYGSQSGEQLFKNGISYTSTDINNGLSGPTNKSLNPQFANPTNADFKLQSASPAIDAGTTIGFIDTDIVEVERPKGNGFDIGPYEYVPVESWPGDNGTLIANANNLGAGYEPSGAAWHSVLNKLVIVGDDGDVTTMDADGSNVTTWHPGGDIEGVTIVDPAFNYIYLGIEQPDSIQEFDISTGQLTGKSWDLTPWMIGPSNSGLEALTFVPNGMHPYSDSNSGGLFYAGLQADGKIYVFDVDLSSTGSVSHIDTITPIEGYTDISGLNYNKETDILYAVFDSSNILVEMHPDGTVIAKYNLPGDAQEGIAVVTSYPYTTAHVYIAEDTGEVWSYGNYPVSSEETEETLEAYIYNIESNIPGKDTEAYTIPSPADMNYFQDIIDYIFSQQFSLAQDIAQQINYELVEFVDKSNNHTYYILRENIPILFGWGTYVFNLSSQNELIIEVPHPLYEFGTCQAGIEIFKNKDAKAFLLAGTHRYANSDESSDVAHNANSIFQLIHELISTPSSKTIQIHGFSIEKHPDYPDIVISSGTADPLPEFYIMKDIFEGYGISVGIYDGANYSDLGATTNVQGQYTNSIGAKFFHIELCDTLRNDPAKLENLKEIINYFDLQSSLKNIILFIGDGMGFEHVKAGRIFAVGPDGTLNMETPNNTGEVITDSLNGVTDSAAAGSAIATGYKFFNGYVSQDENGTEYKTILEYAKELGKRTGLVTTTEITHATPASFGAHTNDRNNWDEIANDYIYGSQPNILFGGGQKHWLPSTESGSVRSDNGLIDDAEAKGYAYVDTSSELASLNMDIEDKVLGLFTLSHMTYEYGKPSNTTEPYLSTMTEKALDLLEEDPDGFFLMVEGGRIDHASHANNITNTVYETEEFDNAVAVALEWIKTHPNTLLIITADHETGGLEVLYGDYQQGQIPDVTWLTTGHTDTNVPIWGKGPGSSNISYTLDNIDIFSIMLNAIGNNQQ